jgi:DNA replication protein DnaC
MRLAFFARLGHVAHPRCGPVARVVRSRMRKAGRQGLVARIRWPSKHPGPQGATATHFALGAPAMRTESTATINRTQIEELATGAFIGRQDNLVIVGQSGVGKSRIIQSVGQAACVMGYRVRYTTRADLLVKLTASLADRTFPKRLRYFARFDWLIIDEFAFDKIERSETPQAANLLYKIIDARSQRSTTVVTNIDIDAWGACLDDPPIAMAFLDRVVDGAIIIKINGKSYRAHRAGTKKMTATK